MFTGNDQNNTQVSTGDVIGSNVSANQPGATIQIGSLNNSKTNDKIYIFLIILMCFGILLLFGSLIFVAFGNNLNKSLISLIRLCISICCSPFLGTMAGDAFFNFKDRSNATPFAFRVTGTVAIILILLVSLNVFDLPTTN